MTNKRQQPPSRVLTVEKQDPAITITSKEQIQSKYPHVFKGIGRFPRLPYHIQDDTNITLKQTPCRPVPIHLKKPSKKKLTTCSQPVS